MKKPVTRHVVSINDLTEKEIETIFGLAEVFLKDLSTKSLPYRIARSTTLASKYILATVFYEPSTRTRLSFESAMIRLGGQNITSADPNTSSAAKGESLADSVRVVSNYADLIVIRHPKDGAARLAADYASVPVINGGDGSHEHPTQTLCDLFTLKKKNKSLKNLNVAIAGDLKGSRTIHSFVYALARFGAHIVPMPAPGMELPPHVDRRLREEFHCNWGEAVRIGALYRTPDEAHQPALFPGPDFELNFSDRISAVYVTRFQKERWIEKQQSYPKIDSDFLKAPKFSHANVLHPLPRVGELDASVDSDARAVYFEQAAYGVPVRMALICLLLGLTKIKGLRTFEGGFEEQRVPLYDQPRSDGLSCNNGNCIVDDSSERQYVRNKFHVVKIGSAARLSFKLRCAYCESDVEHFVLASKKGKWFTSDVANVLRTPQLNYRDIIAFASESDAYSNGFHTKRHTNTNHSHDTPIKAHS
jgi:aspartate carbamoyltransferase catalytic subunit